MAAKKSGSKKTAPRKKPEKKPEKKIVECESERFTADLLVRGEAVRPDTRGGLPPGATHEIVEESGKKPAKVRRRRFSTT
jgi:hypothetical protein